MLRNKKRLSKALLKKSDVFFILSKKFINILFEKRKYFFIFSMILILIIVVFSILRYNFNRNEKLEFIKLAKVEKLYNDLLEESNYEEAYSQVKEDILGILYNFKSKKVNRIGNIIFAKMAKNACDFNTSISIYHKLLKKFNDDIVIKNVILGDLAHSYLLSSDFNRALEYFKKINLEDNSIMKEDALFHIPFINKIIGIFDQDDDLHKQFITNFPDSIYSKLIKENNLVLIN